MILVDERVGSRELLQSIRNLGADAELGGQLAADFQFSGNGATGEVLIGIERKTIQDFCNSMREKRFEGQQLGPLLNTYDVCYMLVEGIWRRGDTGFIEQMFGSWRQIKGGFRYSEVDAYLCWLEEFWGIRCWRCGTVEETAAYIVDRFNWWSKSYEKHHKPAVYAPGPDTRVKGRAKHKPSFRREATLLEKIVAQLPGVDGRAVEVAARFGSVEELIAATSEDWVEKCKGLRLGKKTAEVIVDAIRS